MDYMTLKEAGQKWNVTPRQVNYLCSGGRIPGAVKMAGVWLIPKTAEKPIDGRTKQGKGLHHALCTGSIIRLQIQPAPRKRRAGKFDVYS